MLGEKKNPKHENEELPYSCPVKAELEMRTAENLRIGVDTTAKYVTNKNSRFFLTLLPSFHTP